MPSESAATARPTPLAIHYSPVASSSATPGPSVEPPREAKLDGRRTHIVDRALDYVALADQGLSAARIARKRRRSQGYVSIALRLGRAIIGMEPGELAALRSPRITWKLAQRIVRDDADVVTIRQQLRAALGGFSSHNVDGRKHRKGRRRTDGGSVSELSRPIGAGLPGGWDGAAFARDPIAFVEAHRRHLEALLHGVQSRAARAVAARSAVRVSVGQGIRMLQRSLGNASTPATGGPPGTAAERQALAALEILQRKLTEASVEISTLLGALGPLDRHAGVAADRPESGSRPRLPREDGLDDALEADLSD
jgi:hypothetical protein